MRERQRQRDGQKAEARRSGTATGTLFSNEKTIDIINMVISAPAVADLKTHTQKEAVIYSLITSTHCTNKTKQKQV